MSERTTALRELEKRLAEASGPITATKDIEALIRLSPWHDTHESADPIWGEFVKALQGSIDAAVALFERALWGRGLLIGKGRTRPDEPLWGVQILASDENEERREMPVLAEAESDTLPLAICLATVRALKDCL